MAFPPGPKKGTLPAARREQLKEAKKFASEIVDNPEYRAALLRRSISGQLPAAVEILLLQYKYGKPADVVQLDLPALNGEELGELTEEQLAQRAEQLANAIRGGRRLELIRGGSDKIM